MLSTNKELFQWEKNRYVYLDETDVDITYVQFYNAKSKLGPEVEVIDGKAQIPDYLLEECLPIMALACVGVEGETQVVTRRQFKVLKRAKPAAYVDDSDEPEEPDNPDKPVDPDKPDVPGGGDIIYDGGEEV